MWNVYEQKKQEALEAERILKEKEEKEAKEKVQYVFFITRPGHQQRSRKLLYVFVDLSVLLWVIVIVNAYEFTFWNRTGTSCKERKGKIEECVKKRKKSYKSDV